MRGVVDSDFFGDLDEDLLELAALEVAAAVDVDLAEGVFHELLHLLGVLHHALELLLLCHPIQPIQ